MVEAQDLVRAFQTGSDKAGERIDNTVFARLSRYYSNG